MKNAYYQDIVNLLLDSGDDGLKVYNLARHVYNRHCGLFAGDIRFRSIHNQVQSYLSKQITRPHSPFRRLRWGWYAIKPDYAVQLDFSFEPCYDSPREEEKKSRAKKAPDPIQLTFF